VIVADRQDATRAAALIQDDVGDHRLALHVDAGGAAADHVDALDLAGRYALQDRFQAVALGRGSLAVDQHIARGAFEAPHAVAPVEGKTRQPPHHV
jgi:hypothetical protein